MACRENSIQVRTVRPRILQGEDQGREDVSTPEEQARAWFDEQERRDQERHWKKFYDDLSVRESIEADQRADRPAKLAGWFLIIVCAVVFVLSAM